MVASYCEFMGGRRNDATISALYENFVWNGLEQYVSELVKGCMH